MKKPWMKERKWVVLNRGLVGTCLLSKEQLQILT